MPFLPIYKGFLAVPEQCNKVVACCKQRIGNWNSRLTALGSSHAPSWVSMKPSHTSWQEVMEHWVRSISLWEYPQNLFPLGFENQVISVSWTAKKQYHVRYSSSTTTNLDLAVVHTFIWERFFDKVFFKGLAIVKRSCYLSQGPILMRPCQSLQIQQYQPPYLRTRGKSARAAEARGSKNRSNWWRNFK